MAPLGYDAPGLLGRFNLMAGRPNTTPTTDAIADDTKYTYLSDAQQYTLTRLSSIVAKVLYGAPALLSTNDGGYTYTFGQDADGNNAFPLGRTGIFTSLAAVPDYPLQPGVDYLDEGTRIRGVDNMPITGPLYRYGLAPIEAISQFGDPVLQPPSSRMLIVIKAVADFAESANIRNGPLCDRMTLRYEREFGQTCTMLRKHLRGGRCWLLSPYGAAGLTYSH